VKPKLRRSPGVLSAVMLLVCALTARHADVARPPLRQPTIDTTLSDGARVRVVASYRNDSSDTLSAEVRASSCSCYEIEVLPDVVAPNEDVEVRVSTPRLQFAVQGWVELAWSDGKTSLLEFNLPNNASAVHTFPTAIAVDALARGESTLKFLAMWTDSVPEKSAIEVVAFFGNNPIDVELAEPVWLDDATLCGKLVLRDRLKTVDRRNPVVLRVTDLPPCNILVF